MMNMNDIIWQIVLSNKIRQMKEQGMIYHISQWSWANEAVGQASEF